MSDYNEHIPDGAGDNGDADELVCQSEGCGKAAHCPLKRLGKGDTAVNIIGVAGLGRHRRGEHLRAIRADQMGRQIRAQGNTIARLIR